MPKRERQGDEERACVALSTSGAAAEPASWLFWEGTLAWTWMFWWLATVTGQRWLEFPTVLLFGLGAIGPLAIAVLLVAPGGGAAA